MSEPYKWMSLVCVDARRKVRGAYHETCGEPACKCECHVDKETPNG